MREYNSHEDIYHKLKINYVPFKDSMAYEMNPKHNWVYNKLELCQKLGVESGPFGTNPTIFPIVIKPIISIRGFSRGFYIVKNKEEYEKMDYVIGSFWSPFFKGEHFIYDLILEKGKVVLFGTLKAHSGKGGSFNMFETTNKRLPVEITNFINKYFYDYTGLMNIEIIGNKIIEVHLRLNGDNYIFDEEINSHIGTLYKTGKWKYPKNNKFVKKFIFPVFNQPNLNVNFNHIKNILHKYDKNIFTYRFNKSNKDYISPGGKRYLIFDTNNKEIGEKIKKEINNYLFSSTVYSFSLKLILIFVLLLYFHRAI